MKIKKLFLVFISLLTLDQVSKILIRSNYNIGESKNILGNFLRFTRVENPGAVFGFKLGNGSFNYFFFLTLTIVAIIFIIYLLITNKHYLARIALTIILSGAVGNLIDRIAFKKVTDFLDVDFWDVIVSRWYTFNIADSCIVVGVILLLIYYLFFDKENNTQEIGNKRSYNET